MPNYVQGRVSVGSANVLKPGQTLRDIEFKGFGARRRQGPPGYFLQTRIKGRLRWLTIGKHGAPWTPVSARKEALRLLTEINGGRDPSHDRKAMREAPTVKEA